MILLQNAGKKPLFVQMIMDNIWKVYNTVLDEHRYGAFVTFFKRVLSKYILLSHDLIELADDLWCVQYCIMPF